MTIKKINSGRSLIEMLGVLGIMAMITVLGMVAYSSALNMFKMNKVKEDVATISQASQNLYAPRKWGAAGASMTDLLETGLFKGQQTTIATFLSLTNDPNDATGTANVYARTAFGGDTEYLVAGAGAMTVDEGAGTVTFEGAAPTECTATTTAATALNACRAFFIVFNDLSRAECLSLRSTPISGALATGYAGVLSALPNVGTFTWKPGDAVSANGVASATVCPAGGASLAFAFSMQ